MDEKKPVGRPPKPKEIAFDDLSEDEKVLSTYMDGGFDSAVCKAIEVSKEEFDDRCKADLHFKRVVSYGRTLCQAWWESKYRDSANGAKLNAPMVNFAMKNFFGWAEKSEVTSNDLAQIEGMSRDEAIQKIRSLMPGVTSILEGKKKA